MDASKIVSFFCVILNTYKKQYLLLRWTTSSGKLTLSNNVCELKYRKHTDPLGSQVWYSIGTTHATPLPYRCCTDPSGSGLTNTQSIRCTRKYTFMDFTN
ncbi:hypothetical protein QE152_g39232 [Popillia japonica]|uniref:Uncharacterized protein n=1 Tax=Popillia japonica TaxID=7064 RepID=A0AAW1HUR0_POPJA